MIAGRSRSPFIERDHGAPNLLRYAFPFRGELDIITSWRLARIIREQRVDIIHAHTSQAHTHAIMARRLAGRGKVVVSRRVDFVPSRAPWNRLKYHMADHFIAISHKIGDILRAFGISEDKLTVVHSGVDPARFDVEPLSREELGIAASAGPVIGNVAALVGHKDQATLIAAMPCVLREFPEATCLVAGEGPLRNELESQIARLGVGRAVKLLGYRNDAPRLLRALDVFVMSSKDEGLGTSILDAMICGRPVVATAGGGIGEIVKHEATGLLAPVGDYEALGAAIIRIVRDPDLARNMAATAKQFVLAEFTAARMAEGNAAVYRRLMRQAP